LRWPRQWREQGGVAEQDLQQQRQVAHDADIGRRQPRQREIARQSREARRKAEQRREDPRQDRNQQGVEQSDQQGAAIGRQRRKRNQALVDAETGDIMQKGEGGRDSERAQVFARIEINKSEQGAERQQQPGLDRETSHGRRRHRTGGA
jgi:hypothetical protein